MYCVKRPQPNWVKAASNLEDRRRHLGEHQRIQHSPRPQRPVRDDPANSPHQLGPNQIAGHQLDARRRRPTPQSLSLRLSNYQLPQGRGLDIERHLNTARYLASPPMSPTCQGPDREGPDRSGCFGVAADTLEYLLQTCASM